MLITCLKELEEKGELTEIDIVKFTVKKQIIKYSVCYTCLSLINSGYNDKIFEILKINKYKLTEKTYGYKANSGMWPSSEYRDYPALTRLVKELYSIIEEPVKGYTKFTRFEIMEI